MLKCNIIPHATNKAIQTTIYSKKSGRLFFVKMIMIFQLLGKQFRRLNINTVAVGEDANPLILLYRY